MEGRVSRAPMHHAFIGCNPSIHVRSIHLCIAAWLRKRARSTTKRAEMWYLYAGWRAGSQPWEGHWEGWRVASKRLGALPRIRRGAQGRGCGREGRGALPLPRAAAVSTGLRVLAMQRK